MNDWVCKQCKEPGHKSNTCPIDNQASVDPDQQIQYQNEASGKLESSSTEQAPVTQTERRERTPKENRRKKKGKKKQKSKKSDSKPVETYFKSAVKDDNKQQKNKTPVCRSPPTPIDELKMQKKSKTDDSSESPSSDDEDYHDSSGSDSRQSQDTLT